MIYLPMLVQALVRLGDRMRYQTLLFFLNHLSTTKSTQQNDNSGKKVRRKGFSPRITFYPLETHCPWPAGLSSDTDFRE